MLRLPMMERESYRRDNSMRARFEMLPPVKMCETASASPCENAPFLTAQISAVSLVSVVVGVGVSCVERDSHWWVLTDDLNSLL